MLNFNGRPQPVRRVLTEAIYGELPATISVRSACPNKLCVSPNHTLVKHQHMEGHVTLAPPADFEEAEDDIMDVVDTVYSTERVRREFTDLTMRIDQETHLVATGADVQVDDLIAGMKVRRVNNALGVKILELQG